MERPSGGMELWRNKDGVMDSKQIHLIVKELTRAKLSVTPGRASLGHRATQTSLKGAFAELMGAEGVRTPLPHQTCESRIGRSKGV